MYDLVLEYEKKNYPIIVSSYNAPGKRGVTGRANVVADVLSRNVPISMAEMMALKWQMLEAFS